MFAEIEGLLSLLEKGCNPTPPLPPSSSSSSAPAPTAAAVATTAAAAAAAPLPNVAETTREALRLLSELEGLAIRASENMIRHLQREETEVLPLIQRCFSREEMARLVGTILGERPGDLMDTILAMMFRNLTPECTYLFVCGCSFFPPSLPPPSFNLIELCVPLN